MRQLFTDIKNLLLDTLFPIHCVSCGNPNAILCQTCMNSYTKVSHQVCIACGKPSLGGITHASCQTPHGPNGMLSLFDYQDRRVAQSVIYGKYKFIPNIYSTLGNFFGDWLVRENKKRFFQDYIVIPLPLAKSRQRWRGFNQAEIIGEKIATKLNLFQEPALARIRNTKIQKDLQKDARKNNVADCFAILSKAPEPWYGRFILLTKPEQIDIKHKNILLVDDVVTTGATLREATKILKQNGAKNVWCITLARD